MTADEVASVLRLHQVDAAQAKRLAALAGGNATRALEMVDGGEDSLRSIVAAWFFASVRGSVAPSQWATRETLPEGLDIVKSLSRDWIVAGTVRASSALAPDYAPEIAGLRPLDRAAAVRLLEKLEDAHRTSQSNVTPALVADSVRMALAPMEPTRNA
jgi:hypothetical protein